MIRECEDWSSFYTKPAYNWKYTLGTIYKPRLLLADLIITGTLWYNY